MSTTTAPRMKQRYNDEIKATLREQLGLTNVMQVPTVTKVVVTWVSVTPPGTPS